MIRYSDKQKLDAVEAYRKGDGGLLATASAQGVDVASLRKWVAGNDSLGDAGVVTKRRSNYDPAFKLVVLRRMSEEGLSCNQAAALFNVRRRSQVAEWWRLYSVHGEPALRPGWKEEQTTMKEPRRQRDDEEAPADDQRSREELLRDVQQLRMENADLKKSAGLGSSQETLSARERTLIVIELSPHFPLASLSRTACLPRSSFYYQQRALKTIDKYCDLKTKIREIFDRTGGR